MLTSWHSRVPLAADVERIERVVRAYIARIETRNNVALCQAEMCETDDACDPVPRVFAVATRPIPAGAGSSVAPPPPLRDARGRGRGGHSEGTVREQSGKGEGLRRDSEGTVRGW